MKLITIIFSIYIIALSCMPCADAESSVENKTISIHTVTNSSSDNNNNNNNNKEDACSPFCICNCCHCNGFYKSNDYTKKTLSINTFIDKQITKYTSTLFSTFQNSIWQPPQIS